MSLEDDVKSWLTSKTIWGAIIAAASPVAASVFKLEFPPEFSADLAGQLGALFGALLAIYGRVKAVKKIG
jgi:hypothetical protein